MNTATCEEARNLQQVERLVDRTDEERSLSHV